MINHNWNICRDVVYTISVMATYKVIQDIEAEDKLIGPLTLRQFIYAAVALFFAYLSFISIIKHAAVLAIFFFPIAAAAGFLCWPWSLNQPTEVWALSKIRFILKPHRRIWDQSGAKQLVTITAPKRPDVRLTNGLSQTEVRSRLKALADVIDSRGWAIKNVNLNLYSQPMPLISPNESDRLINIDSLPQDVPSVDIQAQDDILDDNNPVAQHFEQMIATNKVSHRDQIIQQLQQTLSQQQNPAGTTRQISKSKDNGQPVDYWFLHNNPSTDIPPNSAMFDQQLVRPSTNESKLDSEDGATADIDLIKIRESKSPDPEFAHLRRLPVTPPTPKSAAAASTKPAMTPQRDPAILEFVGNDDLNVATIERLANEKQSKQQPPDEVIVPLR
jgi:hypothetical protein